MEKGVYTVLMTPFQLNGHDIDLESYDKLLTTQINSNVTGVVVLGTTSESPTLSKEEKLILIKQVWYRCHGKKKVVIGIGGNNTLECIEFGQLVSNYCDYLMVTVPNYNKPSQEGIYQHFKQIDTYVSKPIMLYNIPSRCGVNMTSETIVRTYRDCNNIVAIKEASGSLSQMIDIVTNSNIQLFVGDDKLAIPALSIGADGIISVASNIYPDEIAQICKCWEQENYSTARNIFTNLLPVIDSLFITTNPVPGKYMLKTKGVFNKDAPRLPLVKLTPEEIITIEKKTKSIVNWVPVMRRSSYAY